MRRIKNLVFALVALLCLASCGSSPSEMKYLAVQLVGSDMWSIVNVESGEIVLKDEFKNQPSLIVDDIFYVENGEGKYDYYNVNDAKKPINKTSYLEASVFSGGYALAVEEGKCISVINTDGKVETLLPASIKACGVFRQGIATVIYSDEKIGFIKPNGKELIDKKYDAVCAEFNDGLAVVGKKGADTIQKYIVIDESGKELFSKNASEYKGVCSVGDGIVVMRKADKCEMLDKEGKKIAELGEAYLTDPVRDGLAVYTDGESYGLKDKKGEVVMRAKYQQLTYNAPVAALYDVPQLYTAEKNDKYGIVDKDDNEVIPFDYEVALPLTDERFLVGERKSVSIQDKEKKDVSKDNFKSVSSVACLFVRSNYFDAEGIAKNYAAHISGAAFFGVKAGETFAKYTSQASSPESCEYRSSIDFYEDGYKVTLFFDANLAIGTPRYSTYTDWWGETSRYQSGYDYSYNESARVKGAVVELSVSEYAVDSESRFVKALESELKKAGFTQASPGILKHKSGAGVTIGYSGGTINICYAFNVKDIAQAAERKDRKAKTDVESSSSSSSAFEDYADSACDTACVAYDCDSAAVDSVW